MAFRSKSHSPPLQNLMIAGFFVVFVFGSVSGGSVSRNLDELDESKCGGCPCGNPCPISYPSPPPPAPVLPPPPPPPPKKPPQPSSRYCPPPPAPPSNFMYITGPPGDLYPIDQNSYNGCRRSFAAALPAVVGGGIAVLLMLW